MPPPVNNCPSSHSHASSVSSAFSVISRSEIEELGLAGNGTLSIPHRASKMGGGDVAPRRKEGSYPLLAPKPVGQRIAGIYKDRISQFYAGGQWDKVNLLA